MSLDNISNHLVTRICSLISIIKSNLINKLNTTYKKVVSKEILYIKEDSFCLLYSLSNMSSSTRFVCCQIYRTLFALFVVKHVEFAY